MTLAELLRALDEDDCAYRSDSVLRVCQQAADELDRMQASLTARDTDLMKEVETYKMRWLSCLARIDELFEQDGTPTFVVMPASEEVTRWDDIVERLRRFPVGFLADRPNPDTPAILKEAAAVIERLRALVPSPAEQKQDVTHTPGVTPASEEVTERKIDIAKEALARAYPLLTHGHYWAIRDALERLQYLEAMQPTPAEQAP